LLFHFLYLTIATVLQIKSIRLLLLAFSYVCLTTFLVEKTVVPFLHQHHETHQQVNGDSLDNGTDCFACDLAKATLDAEQAFAFSFAFGWVCWGALQLFISVQQSTVAVIFSSLRAPPIGLIA
jgi:hypothetical protein